MISLIFGKIIHNSGGQLIILTTGGVGYRLMINPNNAKQWPAGSQAEIITHLVVKEDALDLYGFVSAAEKKLFEQFLTVSGIGPKSALHLLSLGSVSEIAGAIGRSDLAYLTKVSGIGKKTAERRIVELKNKVTNSDDGALGAETGELGDVVEGLIALGYSSGEAREAIKKLDAKGKTSQQLLKEVLQRMK